MIVAALAIAAASPIARADELPPPIAAGVAAYNDLEYEQAIALLRPALANKELDDGARVVGYRYLGLSLLALGRRNGAKDAFRRLLELDRRFELPATENPIARQLLEEVRLDLPAEVELSQTAAPAPARADAPIAVDIRVVDPSSQVSGVVVHYRSAGARRFGTVGATPLGGGRFNATIPGTFVARPALEYYVVARGADGRVVASAASAASPLSIAVATRRGPEGSVLSSPLFWAGAGVVVAAGAVATILFLRPENEAPTGQVQVDVNW